MAFDGKSRRLAPCVRRLAKHRAVCAIAIACVASAARSALAENVTLDFEGLSNYDFFYLDYNDTYENAYGIGFSNLAGNVAQPVYNVGNLPTPSTYAGLWSASGSSSSGWV